MGKFKTLLALTFVLFTSFQVAAQSAAEGLLTRDLISPSKVLRNDTKIYNYFFMQQVWPQLNSTAGRQEYVNEYLSGRGGTFWSPEFNDSSTKNYAAGPGLYFATDPHISKAYGNTFIELTIPAGTRFINVVAPIQIKKDTLAALVTEGIVQQSQLAELLTRGTGFYRDTLRVIVQPEFVNFRKMVQTIFTRNNIQFIEYNFQSSLTGFCPKHNYSAFNFLGLQNQNDLKHAILSPAFKNTSLFSTELNIGNLSSQEEAQKADIVKLRTVLATIPEVRKNGAAAIKSYILSQYSPEEYQAIKTRTFGCEEAAAGTKPAVKKVK